jgi:hypothetical protein
MSPFKFVVIHIVIAPPVLKQPPKDKGSSSNISPPRGFDSFEKKSDEKDRKTQQPFSRGFCKALDEFTDRLNGGAQMSHTPEISDGSQITGANTSSVWGVLNNVLSSTALKDIVDGPAPSTSTTGSVSTPPISASSFGDSRFSAPPIAAPTVPVSIAQSAYSNTSQTSIPSSNFHQYNELSSKVVNTAVSQPSKDSNPSHNHDQVIVADPQTSSAPGPSSTSDGTGVVTKVRIYKCF